MMNCQESNMIFGRIAIIAIAAKSYSSGWLDVGSAQTSRTHPRNHRCAGLASGLGCQSNATVNSCIVTGSGKQCIPARKFPVCLSGTLAIMSEARARASAVEKPPTIVTISRFNPNDFNTSSIGPWSRPLRETQIYLLFA